MVVAKVSSLQIHFIDTDLLSHTIAGFLCISILQLNEIFETAIFIFTLETEKLKKSHTEIDMIRKLLEIHSFTLTR